MKPQPFDLELKPITKEDVVWVVKGKFINKKGLIDFKKDNIIFRAVSVQRIKSACEFYLRYKDNPGLLESEHPEYERKIESMKERPDKAFFRLKEIVKYNEWLLKLVFRSVLEAEK